MSDDRRWSAMIAMIAMRGEVDPALNDLKHPRNWIGAQLWASPEYLIYVILRGIALLERDGMAQADAVRQVDARLRLNVLASDAGAVPPAEYVEHALRNMAPAYLEFGPELLTKVIARAQKGLRSLPEDGVWTTANGCPPPDWRWERMEPEEERKILGRAAPIVPRSMHDEEMIDLLVRALPGDELWEWSSPTPSWGMMMGRGGIALVRAGRVLCDVTTMMN
jgi:hypothetical protein